MARLFRFYFDPRGRISRKDFWLRFALVGILLERVLGSIDATLRNSRHDIILHFGVGVRWPLWDDVMQMSAQTPFRSATAIPWLLATVVIAIKRLHDLNRSGWWFALVAALAAVAYALALIFPVRSDAPMPLLWYLLAGFGLAPGVAIWLGLALLGGQKGTNRFGKDPIEPAAGPVSPATDVAPSTPAPLA